MAFFNLGKKLQVLLIAGAMINASGCYESNKKGTDVIEEKDVIQEDERIVLEDPAAYPLCSEFTNEDLNVSEYDSGSTYVIGEVTLNEDWVPCSGNCPEVQLNGPGTISSIQYVDYNTARFRYENTNLPTGDVVEAEVVWSVLCGETSPFYPQTKRLSKKVYICKSDTTGNLTIKEYAEDCFTVVDCPPPPIPVSQSILNSKLKIIAERGNDGSFILHLRGLPSRNVEVKWQASEGELEVVSKDMAIFRPKIDSIVQVVQASVIHNNEVKIEVFRLKLS